MSHAMRYSRARTHVLIVGCLFALPAVGACDFLDVDDQQPVVADSADYSILFIGSSHVGYNDLSWMVEQLAYSVERLVYVRNQIVYGASLDYHSNATLTQEAIRSYDWNFVVLQGSAYGVAYPDSVNPPVFPAIEALKARIDDNHAGTKTVYMMGWAYEDGVQWEGGGSESFDQMQQRIYDNTLAWADSLDLMVAPAGWVWKEALRNKTQEHYLHSADLSHPNLRGSYLTACVFVATMFGRSLTDADFNGGVSEADALELQQVATRVVLDSLDLWNAEPLAGPVWASETSF